MDKDAKSIVVYFSAHNHTRNVATKNATNKSYLSAIQSGEAAQPDHRFSQDATDAQIKDWIGSL